MIKRVFIGGLVVLSLVAKAQDSNGLQQRLNLADSVWNSMPTINFPRTTITKENIIEYIEETEKYSVAYRKEGLKFWYRFPNDRRRYEWLDNTVAKPPQYWIDISKGAEGKAKGIKGPFDIDAVKQKEWDKIYPKLREEYLNSKQLTNQKKLEFKARELYGYLERSENSSHNNGGKLNLKVVSRLFADAAKSFYVPENEKLGRMGNYIPLKNIEMIFTYRNNFGLTLDDLQNFVMSFENSSVAAVKEWANQKRAFLRLSKEPIVFKSTSTKGIVTDLNDLKGKVVLMDFWNTGCKVCIARMPTIKKVYDKYKDKGFEVLSISIDPLNYKEKVEEMEHKIGAHWPLYIIGGKTSSLADYASSYCKAIWEKYGFKSVPQLLLLNKKGIMVEYNGVLLTGDFEPLVKKLLAEK